MGARKAPGVKPSEPPTAPQAPDAGASLYRDKSGPARGVPLSEGKDNFAAVTSEARKTVQLAEAESHD